MKQCKSTKLITKASADYVSSYHTLIKDKQQPHLLTETMLEQLADYYGLHTMIYTNQRQITWNNLFNETMQEHQADYFFDSTRSHHIQIKDKQHKLNAQWNLYFFIC